MATGGSFEKDEQFCKRVIRKIRTKFVEDLNPVTFVDACLTEEYLTNIQARDIKETILTSDKNRHILDIVSKKGVNGYNGFKMCLEISLQNHLVEYLNKIESEIEKVDPADEESGMNKEQGYHCFSCTFSCESLKLLEQHLKTTKHLDMVNEQIKFSEKNTEPNEDEESDSTILDNNSFQHSYSEVQKCFICNINFTSESHARSHFNGKPHVKKQNKFEKMRQLKDISLNTDSFRSQQLAPVSVVDQTDSLRASLSEETRPVSSPLTESDPNTGLNCNICNVSFTGPENAKQHFESDKHTKKVLQVKQAQEGEVLPLTCNVCNCTFNGQESAKAHFNGEKHKKKVRRSEAAFNDTSFEESESELAYNDISVDGSRSEVVSNDTSVDGKRSEFASSRTSVDGSRSELPYGSTSVDGKRSEFASNDTSDNRSSAQSTETPKRINALKCDICKVTFTGPESAEQHYNSPKHKKKEKLMKKEQQGDILPLSCEICNCSFSGQESAEAHFKGAKHKRKKRESEIGGYPVSCSTCNCSFSGQDNARDHFESARHKQIEKNMQTGNESAVPDELASDPRTIELYEAAIREGKERDRNIRVMVVGCYGQGKSSLVRRLTGQSLEGVESTNGIEVQICESIVETQELWAIKHSGDVRDESMKRLATAARLLQHQPLENTEHISSPVSSSNCDTLTALKASSVTRPVQNQPNTDHISSAVSSGNSDTTRNYKIAQQSDEKESKNVSGAAPTIDSPAFSKEIKTINGKENILQEKTLEINIWDFGGQFVYYATHQLFHSRQAIYILVFDIAKGLGVKVYDEECPYEDMEKSMEEYLKFWIGSVHSFVGNEEGTEPPIFLVGTHLDMLDEHIDQDRQFEDVRQLFDDTLCASHIQPEQFAVSCTNPNHATFTDIRRAITAYALKKSAGLFIPAKWIPLERSLKENRHLKIITFEKVKEFDRSNDIPIASEDQLKLFLQYHHEKGTFFYFENENDAINHVVLDPQFLIDAFRCIITADKFCCIHQNLRKLWQKLRNEAVLEKELLDELWKKESDKEFMKFKKPLLFFLQKHRIIAEALAFDEASSTPVPLNFYIVPSLLKNTSEGMIDDFLKGKRYTKVSIGYNFEYVSTLCTVYNRVVAAALGRWPILKFRSTSLVYENAMVCKMNLSHSGILKRLKNSLELLVVSLCPEDVCTKVCDAFRRFVEMVIQDELHKFQTKDTEKQGRGYREVVRCYDKDHGYSGSCDFYEFDSLQTQNKDIIGCPDHENHYFSIKEIMTEWFNADIDADVPKRTLTEKELSKLSTSIGKNWEHLARMLGFSDAVIDQVSIDKVTTPARIYEILKRWRAEQLDCATLDVLISAVRQCGQSLTVNKDTLKNLTDGTSLSRQY